jgi:hypothetical protein
MGYWMWSSCRSHMMHRHSLFEVTVSSAPESVISSHVLRLEITTHAGHVLGHLILLFMPGRWIDCLSFP